MRRLVGVLLVATAGWLLAQSPWPRLAWWLATAPAPSRYVVPVSGVGVGRLQPSFGAPRSDGRRHQGIDIFAPRGTPVVAAADGVVVGTMPNRLGGTVVWVLGAGRRLYYYAHLHRLDEATRVGRIVAAGDALGAVGTTGNARGGPPHLHFGVYRAGARGAVDPYPLLAGRSAS